MEVESDLLFTQTSVWYRPLMVHMMKVSSLEEINNLKVDNFKAKRKCKCYGLLTPHLTKAVAETDMKIYNVFLKVVETIRILITLPATDAAAQTEDEILTNISEPYDYLLYFLWESHKFPSGVNSPLMAAIQDEEPLSWEKETREAYLGTAKPVTVDVTKEEGKSSVLDEAIAAITRLLHSMIEYQKAALKKQEEKNDSRLKS